MQRTPIAYSTSYRQPLAGSLALAAAVALLVLVLAACSSSSNIGGNGDSGSADALGGDVVVDAPGDVATDGCLPTFTDCEDLCGPVRDRCTGEFHPCGPCIVGGLVCDLETNSCVEPLDDCKELNAECGEIRNSCGGWVKNGCGYCPADKECDPDTNTCVDCKDVTCEDLGFECGEAWLGCGSQVGDKTDCKECDEGKTCNESLHICEPETCSGKTDAELCTEAKTQRGVECGSITNGCGAMIDCTGHLDPCPTGTSCGVLGVANRCDFYPVADECLARGAQCNYKDQLKSKCTDGQGNPVTLYCGECTAPDVCNPNNQCGPPCEPKTCDDLEDNQCGTQLDDGCEGKLNCGCDDAKCDTAEIGKLGSCVTALKCEDYTDGAPDRQVLEGKACSNGNAFDDGTGTLFRCRCKSGLLCIDGDNKVVSGANKGTCCKNENPTCSGENGPCRVTNSCTGASSNCCNGTLYCETSSNTCAERLVCEYYQRENDGAGDWKDPIPCSNTPIAAFKPIPGETEEMACRCPLPNQWCINQTGETPGECCTFVLADACGASDGDSNCQVTNPCTGTPESCCDGDEYCDNGTCREIPECSDLRTGSGLPGEPCGTYHYGSDNSRTRECDCRDDSPYRNNECEIPSGEVGTCECTPNTCRHCGDDNQWDGCGTRLDCPCGGGQTCYQNECCTLPTCTGEPFSTGQTCRFSNCGRSVTCDCIGNDLCYNSTCCDPRTCPTGGVATEGECRFSTCGRTVTCACDNPNDTCYNNHCCTLPVCRAPAPTGGTCRFSACGQTKTCACADPYDTCGGGANANTCGCTPTITSCGGNTDPDFRDDCGNLLGCGG